MTECGIPRRRRTGRGFRTRRGEPIRLSARRSCCVALAREESRGGHTRDDFPGPDSGWGTKNLVVNLNEAGTGVDLHEKPLPEMPDELKGYFA